MLINKDTPRTRATLRTLARALVEFSDEKRRKVLDSIPSDDRMILVEMIKALEDDRPLLKG